ncbi:MAG: hypothetical protein KJZ83_09155 [Burkholderiaceae bacterium]|nr:hypothetical protein [Burkholderiaceae bacterium]
MATDTQYADRIINLSIHNGLVRIDLGTVDTYLDGEERKQRAEVTQRVVMPVDGFVRSFAMQQRMLDQLNERAKSAQGAADAEGAQTGASSDEKAPAGA